MDPSKRTGVGFPFAPTSAALVLCALMSATSTLTASVVPISSITNRGAASGSLTFGDGTVQDVTNLLAINTDSARNTAPAGLGNILRDAGAFSRNGDLALFSYGTPFLSGSGSNGSVTLETGHFAFTSGIVELDNGDFTRAFRASSAGGDADLAAFDTARMAYLESSTATFIWNAGSDTLSSGSMNGTGPGILTASTHAIQSDTASPILAGTGSTMTKTPVEPDALTATKTWDGGHNNSDDWSKSNNWGGTGAPAAGDSLFFGGSTRLTPNNDLTADTSFAGITFNSGAGAFTLIGNRITLGGNVTNNSTTLQTINLAMILSANRTFTTSTGGGDLTIGEVLSETGGARGITKAGAGTLTLSGANTYTGATTVSAGVLNVRHATALGTIAGGTTVSNGATLQLQGGITVGSETLNIRGTGAGGQTGALVNVSGTNNYGGLLTLAGATTLSSNSGTLNLTNAGTITGATFGLTLTGAGNGSISSIIGISTGSLTKSGTGTWTLSGVNTYLGGTTINGGTLTLANGSGIALGFTSGVTVNSGGTLLLGANNQINNLASLTLGGGTFARGNFNEGSTSTAGLGALILSAGGSHLDFGTGAVGTLTFASFAPGAFTLTIDNWTGTFGTVGDGTTDRLIFTSNQSANLGSFNFTGFGPGAVAFDLGGGYWEIVPVPEAGTYFSGSIVLVLILLHHRRQFRQLIQRLSASRKLRFSTAHGTGVAS